MPPVTMIDRTGQARDVPEESVAAALAQGFTVEDLDARIARVSADAKATQQEGFVPTLAAGISGFTRGATFGLSDVGAVALGGEDSRRSIKEMKEAHGTASLVGEVVGTLATAIPSGGASFARLGAGGASKVAAREAGEFGLRELAALTPSGATARLGAKIAASGAERGAVREVGALAGAGATEGAIQGAGAYVSDVALGDKELSADAFVGSMARGALWGGAAGGGLGLGAKGLTAARRLFPSQEITREVVQRAESEAVATIKQAVDEQPVLLDAARTRMRQLREERAALDLTTKAKLDEIAIAKAQEVADLDIAAARSKAEGAAARAERAKAGPAPRTKRKAMAEEPATVAEPPAIGQVAEGPAGLSAIAGTEDATTLLERQLGAMKGAIDEGATLPGLNAQRPRIIGDARHAIEDAQNAHMATVDPEIGHLAQAVAEAEAGREAIDAWLARYGGKDGNVGRFERGEASRATAASWRKKEGWVDRVPAGEGNRALARGSEKQWIGSDAARDGWRDSLYARSGGEDALAAGVERVFPRATGEEIVEGAARAADDVPLDAKVQQAIGARVDDLDDDIGPAIDAINRMEAAEAQIAEALGPAAPTGSQARGAAFREAQVRSEKAAGQASQDMLGDADKAARTIGLDPKAAPGGAARGALDKALAAGDVIEALHMMGLPVPDPQNIPVIGPVLKQFLRARVLMKAWGRFGGRVPTTAETTIATKAAAARQRVNAAVDTMLVAGARGANAAARTAPTAVAVLGHSLFGDKPDAKANSKDLVAQYNARVAELERAREPRAIFEAVRNKVRASDPEIVQAIASTYERKAKFLDGKRPRVDIAPSLLAGGTAPPPSKAEIIEWARYVEAADDPVGVVERIAAGALATPQAAETLRTVYPKLYAEMQARLISKAADEPRKLPYSRRVALSTLFDVPLDDTMAGDYTAFLQSGYAVPAPQPTSKPPTPTITADVNIGARTSVEPM